MGTEEKRKGKKPIIPFSERIEIVKNLKFVDMVVPQNTMNKKEIWENLKFNKMFVGDDWKGTPSWNNLEKEFNDINVEIVYFPYTTHTSSTILRDVLSKIK